VKRKSVRKKAKVQLITLKPREVGAKTGRKDPTQVTKGRSKRQGEIDRATGSNLEIKKKKNVERKGATCWAKKTRPKGQERLRQTRGKNLVT